MSEQNEVQQPVTQMGATFAERKAAREAFEKRQSKAVENDDEVAENKALSSSETKRPARKKS